MRLTRAEQEVIIRRAADEDSWDIFSEIPSFTRQLRQLASLYGVSVQEFQHGVRVKLPKRALALRKPVSEAKRQAGLKNLAHLSA